MGVKLGDCTGCLQGVAPDNWPTKKNWFCKECSDRQVALAEAFWRTFGVDPSTVLLPGEWQ